MTSSYAVASRHPLSFQAVTAFRGVRALIIEAIRSLDAARRRARTVRMLHGLDDSALADIGLHRSQIDAIEHHPRYAPFARRRTS